MTESPVLFTIGFTKKSAEQFFGALIDAGVKRIIDIRLNNSSQLAGFAKRDDLAYFLRALGGIDYVHRPDFAPTQAMLDAYKKQKGKWTRFERDFKAVIAERRIERTIETAELDHACLLCSEATPEYCHRRLTAEYLERLKGPLTVRHL